MQAAELNISQLASAAGLSRRAVRFYVQQGLLPPPQGRGRGSHYRAEHLERLKEILKLQEAGHSLDAIRIILDGQPAPASPAAARRAYRPRVSAELWTRLKLMEGVELHFNAARFAPEAEKLLQLRELVQQVFTTTEELEADGANPEGRAASVHQSTNQEPA